MSVEGMWAIYFGDAAEPGAVPNSGVIVLETGKVFGGDSLLAYLGSYEVVDGRVLGTARTWTYNPNIGDVVSAFGRSGRFDVETSLEGEFDPAVGNGRIVGTIFEAANPDARLPFVMHRISNLP